MWVMLNFYVLVGSYRRDSLESQQEKVRFDHFGSYRRDSLEK